MNDVEERFRVVLKGCAEGKDLEVVAKAMASKLSATPDQIRTMLSHGHFVLRSDLTRAQAERYATNLKDTGAIVAVEDENELLEVAFPANPIGSLPVGGATESSEVLIRRIADYEKVSGILFIALGVVQCLTIFGLLAGVWNIFAGWSRIRESRLIRERLAIVPSHFEPIGGLVLIGLVNLILGGVIGVAIIGLDFYVRDQVLSNRRLFDRGPKTESSKLPERFGQPFAHQSGWFVIPDEGRARGPFRPEEMRDFMARGFIHGDTLVAEAPQQRWVRLKTTRLFETK